MKLSGRVDVGAVLERLVSQNALTESIEPGAYQYHLLFAQTLRMRQRLARWDETASLHRAVADWLAPARPVTRGASPRRGGRGRVHGRAPDR